MKRCPICKRIQPNENFPINNGKQSSECNLCHGIANHLDPYCSAYQQSCIFCHSPYAHAHHLTYEQPNKIIWVCNACHIFMHQLAVTLPKFI